MLRSAEHFRFYQEYCWWWCDTLSIMTYDHKKPHFLPQRQYFRQPRVMSWVQLYLMLSHHSPDNTVTTIINHSLFTVEASYKTNDTLPMMIIVILREVEASDALSVVCMCVMWFSCWEFTNVQRTVVIRTHTSVIITTTFLRDVPLLS